MSHSGTLGQPSTEEPGHVEVIDLGVGGLLLVVTGNTDITPDATVHAEMQMVANAIGSAPTRGVAADVLSAVVSGVIGGAAWAGVASGLTATQRFVRKVVAARTSPATIETVAKHVRLAYARLHGAPPPAQSVSHLERGPDGTWGATVSHDGITVDVKIDSTCSLILWSRRPPES
jgi:hypothetical protein